ncbi:MAG: hypothetical protein OXE99_10890 [Cellvibrionales bacterium]|nr:hypothetical protein [Cellvibrionales bacterium]
MNYFYIFILIFSFSLTYSNNPTIEEKKQFCEVYLKDKKNINNLFEYVEYNNNDTNIKTLLNKLNNLGNIETSTLYHYITMSNTTDDLLNKQIEDYDKDSFNKNIDIKKIKKIKNKELLDAITIAKTADISRNIKIDHKNKKNREEAIKNLEINPKELYIALFLKSCLAKELAIKILTGIEYKKNYNFKTIVELSSHDYMETQKTILISKKTTKEVEETQGTVLTFGYHPDQVDFRDNKSTNTGCYSFLKKNR